MIAQAETQSVLFKHENEAIKTTLLSSHIPIPTRVPVSKSVSEQNTDTTTSTILQERPPQSDFSISGSLPSSQWQSNTSSGDSLVSMIFDEIIDASCLKITPPTSFVPNPYALAATDPTLPASFPGLNPELSKALPKLPDEATAPVSAATLKDLSIIAINFILAFVPHPFCLSSLI
jgi:hypothetical protein